jgi:hypothetical protein
VVIRGAQEGWAPSKLRSELFDRFGEANRDWRRIAITEQNEAAGQGFIASQKPGTKVKRFEMADACAWCRAIHERVMTVVAPQKADKDGETEVWLGKTNVGRSAAPRKRLEDGRLVERPADERWWVAAGTQHPHCRGFWLTA